MRTGAWCHNIQMLNFARVAMLFNDNTPSWNSVLTPCEARLTVISTSMVGHMHLGFRIMFLSLATWNYELVIAVEKELTRKPHEWNRFFTNFCELCELCNRKTIENNGITCYVTSTSSLNCSSSSKWDFAGFADRAPCEVNKLPIAENICEQRSASCIWNVAASVSPKRWHYHSKYLTMHGPLGNFSVQVTRPTHSVQHIQLVLYPASFVWGHMMQVHDSQALQATHQLA